MRAVNRSLDSTAPMPVPFASANTLFSANSVGAMALPPGNNKALETSPVFTLPRSTHCTETDVDTPAQALVRPLSPGGGMVSAKRSDSLGLLSDLRRHQADIAATMSRTVVRLAEIARLLQQLKEGRVSLNDPRCVMLTDVRFKLEDAQMVLGDRAARVDAMIDEVQGRLGARERRQAFGLSGDELW